MLLPMQFDPAAHSIFGRLGAILRLRCPRCCKGRVWRGFFRMNTACPVCDLVFEREPGYFTGAMYASYTLGIGFTLPVWFVMLLAGAGLAALTMVIVVMVVGLMPVSFHYSRVLWMHIDCYFNPKTFISSGTAAGAES